MQIFHADPFLCLAIYTHLLCDPTLAHLPSTSVHAGIRLAGATNDVHLFDVRTGKWEKLTPLGEPPSPRAAHAAAAVGDMVVIQVRMYML